MKLNNNDDSHNSGLNLLIYNMLLDIESHPAWVCGLKLKKRHYVITINGSHPAWVCGLKLRWVLLLLWIRLVTPCVGVWIETSRCSSNAKENRSHPAWVCGLKLGGIIAAGASLGHTLRGCVD